MVHKVQWNDNPGIDAFDPPPACCLSALILAMLSGFFTISRVRSMASRQGLTLLHFPACREQFLCGLVVDLVVSMAKTAQVELRSGRV